MADSLKNKTKNALIWSAIDSFSVQAIAFVVMIFMARMLTPADYGLVGMLSIFMAVSNAFINSGFSTALIRKQDRTEADLSTVFHFNTVMAVGFYLLLFFCAPLIADFYNEPRLTSITRVAMLSLIIGGLTSVQGTIYSANLNFKVKAKSSVLAALGSGAVGLTMAYHGFGPWALVASSLVSGTIGSLTLWFYSTWRPKLIFSFASLKELFGFGSKLLASGLLDTVYSNIYSIVIGKIFSASTLGYYSRAKSFADLPSSNLTSILQRVTYPVLCSIQDDNERLASAYRRMLKVSAFVIFPLMVGLAAVAKPLVLTLLKEKWLFSATLLQIVCFSMMWYPVHAINLNLLQVKGRSDLFLRLEIIKKIVGVTVLSVSVPLGIVAMCVGSIVSSLLCLVINTYYTGKLIDVGFFKQLYDLTPTLLLSVSMGAVVFLSVSLLPVPEVCKLAVGIIEGMIIYVGGAKLFRFAELDEVFYMIRRKQ